MSQRLTELGYENYAAYLRSDHWKEIKQRWRKEGRPRECAVCGSTRYQLHHTTYERFGAEGLDDLAPLCGGHHKAAHRIVGTKINGRRVYLSNAVDALIDSIDAEPAEDLDELDAEALEAIEHRV